MPVFVPPAPVVTAPTLQEEQAVAAWYAHSVPPPLRPSTPFTVRVLSPDALRAYLKQDGADDSDAHGLSVDGVCDTDPDAITLRQGEDDLPDWWTFAHELGHLLWTRRLSNSDRKAYTNLYRRQKRAGSLVTPYAAQDAEEAWAESVSFYVCASPMLAARDPQSFQFVRRWAAAHS